MEKGLLTKIVVLATFVGLMFAAWFALEAKFTPKLSHNTLKEQHSELKEQVQLTGLRLEQKILADAIRNFQYQLWDLQKRYGPDCGPERQQCNWIRAQIEDLKRQLNSLR